MKPKFIFSFLRIATNILWYTMLFISLVVTVVSLSRFAGNVPDYSNLGFNREVLAFNGFDQKPVTKLSADSLVSYSSIPGRYKLAIRPGSTLGYYSFFSMLVFLGIGIGVIWLFKRIFNEANVKDAFKENVYKRLKALSVVFIISDVFTVADYLIFNKLLSQSISVPNFELITDVGDGMITGIVIYAIAVIYQTGLSIQEENELTV